MRGTCCEEKGRERRRVEAVGWRPGAMQGEAMQDMEGGYFGEELVLIQWGCWVFRVSL